MKHLSSIGCVFLSVIAILVSIQLDKANQEIVNLNSQVNAFEIQAGKDSDMIKALTQSLKQKSRSKKKVICIDTFFA